MCLQRKFEVIAQKFNKASRSKATLQSVRYFLRDLCQESGWVFAINAAILQVLALNLKDRHWNLLIFVVIAPGRMIGIE